jgi:hypothetical protein
VIDPLLEDLITPSDATSLYPRGPTGKKVHVSKVYRDMNQGVRGVFLESIRTPRIATSRQAVARFFRLLTELSRSPRQPTSTRESHQRAGDRVDQELDRLGF